MSIPKCSNCDYIQHVSGMRNCFYCSHPSQDYIRDFCTKNRIVKEPGLVCFGGGDHGDKLTIKTSPWFCPKRNASGSCKKDVDNG